MDGSTPAIDGLESPDAPLPVGDGDRPAARAPRPAERTVSRFATFFFDEKRHRSSLPLMASWLVGQERFEDALAILDRYWRTGPDGVDDRLLEAAILRRLRGPREALRAHQRAFAIDPNDPAVQRGLLAALGDTGAADGLGRLAARLLGRARDPAVLHLALNAADPDWSIFGAVEVQGRTCTGWCVWRRADGPRRMLEVLADGRLAEFPIAAVAHAAWTRLGVHHATFRFDWPRGAAIVDVRDRETGISLRGAPLVDDAAVDGAAPPAASAAAVAVVVPVYDDARATRRCFDALLADGTRLARRIIVVDDASPSPMIRAHLDRLAAAGRIELVRNPHNVGFIRAVNRALRRVGDEDVVLLNADTHVPPGWLDRLHAVAVADPTIGTLTPLSNNGELVSIPGRFRSSDLPSPERVAAIDAAAQALGAGTVALPNGVGFCLYIRNAALRAVGGLDAGRYERGYLEEVDLCLRIAEAGFRNLCATSVYVGHQGEASFGAAKRSLVTANAAALMRRWPDIEAQTTAFLQADPLREVCAALAWTALPPSSDRRLVIAARPRLDPAVAARLGGPEGARRDLVTLAGDPRDPGGWRVLLPGVDDPVPVPSEALAGQGDALATVARLAGAADMVVAADGGLDPGWFAIASAAGLPADLMPLDAAALDAVLPGFRSVLAATASMADRAAGLSGGPAVVRLPLPRLAEPAPATAPRGEALGIVPPDASPESFAAIRDLAQALLARGSRRTLVVLGSTIRDVGLMRLGNTFVTGAIDGDDPLDVLAVHRCSALVLTQRDGSLVNRGLDFVRRSGLPFAARPVGGAADLLREVRGGVALDASWPVETLAFFLDNVLGAAMPAPMPDTRLAS